MNFRAYLESECPGYTADDDKSNETNKGHTATTTGARVATTATRGAGGGPYGSRVNSCDLTTIAVVSRTLNVRGAPAIRILFINEFVRFNPDSPEHGSFVWYEYSITPHELVARGYVTV